MADIVFKYEEMKKAVTDIQNIAQGYKTAASTLVSGLTTAISAWEGDSGDKMRQFISGTVKSYTDESIPALLNALANLLDMNITQMQNADRQIADNIPS